MSEPPLTPTEVTGLVAAVYAVSRAIEGGFKKLVGVFTKKAQQDKLDKEEARTAAQFAEIQREMKLQSEAHVQTKIVLTRIETNQNNLDSRFHGIEQDVRALMHTKILPDDR